MKIRVNKAHYPVTVLGPGRRIGIWLQGCSVRCKGCISQDTWEDDPARAIPVSRLLAWCRKVGAAGLDGVTISGGEPFDQPRALAALLDALALWRGEPGMDFDLLSYSGYPLATLQRKHPRLLARLDAVIPEPYVESQPSEKRWRGSANQKLVPLSARGHERYARYVDAPVAEEGKRIQVMVDSGQVWYVGIPARGDMAAVQDRCAEHGIEFSRVSWRQ